MSLTLELGAGCSQYLEPAVELRDMGVDLVLEDFGTGTTLDDVRRLPVSGVKLHPTFVALAAGTPEEVVFPEALLEIAHVRGLTATGKGIETRDQARRLSSMGCDLGQGFLYSKPLGPGGHRHPPRARSGQLRWERPTGSLTPTESAHIRGAERHRVAAKGTGSALTEVPGGQSIDRSAKSASQVRAPASQTPTSAGRPSPRTQVSPCAGPSSSRSLLSIALGASAPRRHRRRTQHRRKVIITLPDVRDPGQAHQARISLPGRVAAVDGRVLVSSQGRRGRRRGGTSARASA